MSSTRLLLGDDARTKILAGATEIAEAVRSTFGPRGAFVRFEVRTAATRRAVPEKGPRARGGDEPDLR